MRSKIDTQKAWEGSSVASDLTVSCSCGKIVAVAGTDIEFESLRRSLSAQGWRFNDVGTRCLCPKCGPKKYPELYAPYSHYQAKKDSDVSQRDSPRRVRRVGVKARKQVKEEVRSPRRVRRT